MLQLLKNKAPVKILALAVLFVIDFNPASGQELKFIKEADLEEIINNPDNKLHVINFWASWCPPCVKEMPVFQDAALSYNATEIKFIMVSLDYPDKMDSQLIPFLKKHNISLNVYLMMDTDYLKWADKVDPAFQGNIPATLFINNARRIRYFHLGEITGPELKSIIEKYKK
jgi:thiol-disulfide isomerase/thioredoxin